MKKPYIEIDRCRVGGDPHLVSILDLGHQTLTGVFPSSAEVEVTSGPLEMVWCPSSGLVQLKHSYDPDEMYGENYGYRSGLNQSMVEHLTNKVGYLERLSGVKAGETVLDIGSNDSTTLRAYQTPGLKRVGIDPTGAKFARYYPDDIKLVSDFFSAAAFRKVSSEPAKVVSSIAMFYDLEDPVAFARQIREVLADDGVWHFEQSYMPSMLRTNSYDTICHEHLEYYSLGVVAKILEAADLRLIDVVMNNVNGGSFAVTAAPKANATLKSNAPVIDWLLEQEDRMGLSTPKPFRDFEERVFRHRRRLGEGVGGRREGHVADRVGIGKGHLVNALELGDRHGSQGIGSGDRVVASFGGGGDRVAKRCPGCRQRVPFGGQGFGDSDLQGGLGGRRSRIGTRIRLHAVDQERHRDLGQSPGIAHVFRSRFVTGCLDRHLAAGRRGEDLRGGAIVCLFLDRGDLRLRGSHQRLGGGAGV